jgi:two-component system KDP operon response regulator KdpE
VPIIMLTAKDEESDKLKGFAVGADDYVTKPFSFAEIIARIHAVLGRARQAPAEHKPKRYASGDLVIDTDSRRVTKAGQIVELTPTEYRLLATLAENSGRVLSHEQLLNKVWGYEFGEDTGYVKRYIWYLRRKIEDDPRKPEHILTERGFGYVFQGD